MPVLIFVINKREMCLSRTYVDLRLCFEMNLFFFSLFLIIHWVILHNVIIMIIIVIVPEIK